MSGLVRGAIKLIALYSNLLEESTIIAENILEGGGYLARSQFKLAQIHTELGDLAKSAMCREAAETIRTVLMDVVSEWICLRLYAEK